MTIAEVNNVLCSFQTAIFRYDNVLYVASKAGHENFRDLLFSWREKYGGQIMYDSSIDADMIELSDIDQFLSDYPNLKEQLRINDTYGYSLWLEYPEGKTKKELDLWHTFSDVYPEGLWIGDKLNESILDLYEEVGYLDIEILQKVGADVADKSHWTLEESKTILSELELGAAHDFLKICIDNKLSVIFKP